MDTHVHDLDAALRDAITVENEALAEDFPIPSSIAQANAKKLLPLLYAIASCRFEVYPTPDAEVAIDARWHVGSSLILLCDSQGGALCLVNNRGNSRQASYSNAEALPDGFVREAIDELASAD